MARRLTRPDSLETAPTEAHVRAVGVAPRPRAPIDPEPGEAELFESFEATFATAARYRRIVATVEDALEFQASYRAERGTSERPLDLSYGALRVLVQPSAVRKMHAWVAARSRGFTLEVQGRFLAKRRPDHLMIDEFIPLPSFCQSLVYEAPDPDDRRRRFGNARVRTIAPDDWKPEATAIYADWGVFAGVERISIDPFKVPVPFHSHYLKSDYQEGPSPGDTDHLHHLKWLYAPRSGKNVLYSGITPFQIDVPMAMPISTSSSVGDDVPANPADTELWVIFGGALRRYSIPPGPDGLIIGRAPECDVVLDDPDVSRRHVRVRWTAEGRLEVEDLGSRNGIRHAGRRLSQLQVQQPCELTVGSTPLRLRF